MADFTNTDTAPGYAPNTNRGIRPSDVTKVKENYGIGAQPRFGKGTADAEIYRFSTKSVIDWWRKLKAQEAADAAAGAAGSGGTPGSSGGGGGGGGTGPMGYRPPPTGVVQPSNTQTQAREGGGQSRPAPTPPIQPAPRPTVASRSIQPAPTRLAPAPKKPLPKPGTRNRPAGGNTGFRAY